MKSLNEEEDSTKAYTRVCMCSTIHIYMFVYNHKYHKEKKREQKFK